MIPCDTVVLAIGQDNAFPFIERNIGLEFGKWDMPVVDKKTFMSTRPGVFFGGDAAFGPAEHHLGGRARPPGGDFDPQLLPGHPGHQRPPQGMTLTSTKMGLHEWAYSNNYNPAPRQKMVHVDMPARFSKMTIEVEKGFTAEQTRGRSRALPELRRADGFQRDSLCIECDACIDICPVGLPDDGPNDERAGRCETHLSAPRTEPGQPLFVSGPLKQTGA